MDWNSVVQAILGVGSTVLIPVLIIILGVVFGMKFSKAFLSGLYLATGFIGMSMAINQLTTAVTPAVKDLAKYTGINLPAVDFGWPGAAAITWAWPWAFLFFVVEIAVNLIMLLTKTTKTLNADMWNVWGIALTAYMVYGVSGNMVWAVICSVIQVIIMLKMGDMWSEEIKTDFGLLGVTTTHIESFAATIMFPVNWLMNFIPIFNRKWDAKDLKKKIGILSEPVVMGAIIGVLLGMAAHMGWQSLNLGVTIGAVMAIFPPMAKFFMDALTPFGTQMSNFMKKHVKGREFVIGLDWPILGQSTELWVTMVIMIPISILWAAILPGNKVLPIAGVINYCIGVGGLLLTGGNLLRMIVLGIIYEPLSLYGATYFANIFTDLAKSTKATNVPAGSQVSWSSIEAPDLRFLMAQAGKFNWMAIIGLIALLALFVLLYFYMKKYPLPGKRYENFNSKTNKE